MSCFEKTVVCYVSYCLIIYRGQIMSWDDFKSNPTKSKEMVYKSSNSSHFYAIFRVGKKYKTTDGNVKNALNMIKHFQRHMEREIVVLNADAKIKNEIIIGDANIYENVKEYIKDIKLRSNAIVARDLLLTASPDFFKNISPGELELWKTENIKWLQANFGSNCVYATIHNDEKSVHCHCLIVPRFTNKKGQQILSNTRYFDGVEKFRSYQDNYSQHIQTTFKCLNRGIKYSKAKNIQLKSFYNLINKELNDKDISQVIAKAKNSELLEIKIRAIEKTLQVYKNYNSKNESIKDKALLEAKSLVSEVEQLKRDKEHYKEAISYISQVYKVPQYVISEAIREVGHINEKEL